jgi:hypothetical protein
MSEIKFQGFEEPEYSPDSFFWLDRVRGLYSKYPNRWAKYGPFKTRKSANNAASSLNKQYLATEMNVTHKLEWAVPSEDEGESYLYLRVVER